MEQNEVVWKRKGAWRHEGMKRSSWRSCCCSRMMEMMGGGWLEGDRLNLPARTGTEKRKGDILREKQNKNVT